MPSVPQNLSSHSIPQLHPPNPNSPSRIKSHDTPSHQAAPGITATASHANTHVLPRRFLGQMPEAVVNSSEVEEQRRRLNAIKGAAVRRLSESALGGVGAKGMEGLDKLDGRRRRIVGRFREMKARRRSSTVGEDGTGEDGDEVDLDLDVDDDDDGRDGTTDESGWRLPLRGKKKKKRKDVWVGESFDIGREFRDGEVRQVDDEESSRDAVRDGQGQESMPPSSPVNSGPAEGGSGTSGGRAPSQAASAPAHLQPGDFARVTDGVEEHDRPAPSRGTTQESFVTARTRFSDARSQASATSSTHDLSQPSASKRQSTADSHDYELRGLAADHSPSTRLSDTAPAARPDAWLQSPPMQPSTSRQSGTSSMHPLISAPETPISESPTSGISPTDPGPHSGAGPSSTRGKTRTFAPTSPGTIGVFRGKLKSALRRPSAPPHTELRDGDDQAGSNVVGQARANAAADAQQSRAKTVQFPVDMDDAPGVMRKQVRKGNKQPARPSEVLAREGEEAEGTSAGAVEEAMADEEEEEEGMLRPGSVIMRGESSCVKPIQCMFGKCVEVRTVLIARSGACQSGLQ